jgi:flavin-dependent dehydrogenase
MKAIIVGAGIGGLITALFLNKHGIDCEVFEEAPAIQELGVGGPERVIDFVLSRLSGSDGNMEDVAPFEDRKSIVHGYSQIAGYSADQLRRTAC